jgi:predicted patatin/cPLA2 family phospholipase
VYHIHVIMVQFKTNKKCCALVLTGGGMRCVYGAGFMCGLKDAGLLENISMVIAASGSAGTAVYAACGQWSDIKDIWTQAIVGSRFICPSRFWKVLDIDYLIDEVFRKAYPLKPKALRDASFTVHVPALDLCTGDLRYFDAKNTSNVFDVLRAAKAQPVFYKFQPGISIEDGVFCDNPLSVQKNAGVRAAVERGASHVLVVDINQVTKSDIYKDRAFRTWLLLTHNPSVHRQYTRQSDALKRYEIPDTLMQYTQHPILSIKPYTTDKKAISETFKRGHMDAMAEKIREFFLHETV